MSTVLYVSGIRRIDWRHALLALNLVIGRRLLTRLSSRHINASSSTAAEYFT